jgi:hypothetical protein
MTISASGPERIAYLRDMSAGFELHYSGGLALRRGVWSDVKTHFKKFYFDLTEEPTDPPS